MVLCGLGKKINAGKGGTPSCSGWGKGSQCHGSRQSFQGGRTLLAPSHSREVRKRLLSCPFASPRVTDGWVLGRKHRLQVGAPGLQGLPRRECGMRPEAPWLLWTSVPSFTGRMDPASIPYPTQWIKWDKMSYFWKTVALRSCQTFVNIF